MVDLSKLSIAPDRVTYEVIVETSGQQAVKDENPELFRFDALSIGDGDGQFCLVPLDESDMGNARMIVNSLKILNKCAKIASDKAGKPEAGDFIKMCREIDITDEMLDLFIGK